MYMKTIRSTIIRLAIALSLPLSAQNHQTSEVLVEYDVLLDLTSLVRYDAQLYFNSSYSYFAYRPAKNTKLMEEQLVSDNENRIAVVDSNQVELSVDRMSNRLLEKKKPVFSKKRYVIEEAIPSIEWKLVEETKKINDWLCRKATTTFRGRTYTAWYCQDLPFSYGPWKLSGLPGLILEASDERKEVLFTIRKLVAPYRINLPGIDSPNGKVLSPTEYKLIQRKAIEDFESRMKAQADRDIDLNISYSMNDIERE